MPDPPFTVAVGARVLLRSPNRGDRRELLDLVRASERLHRRWTPSPLSPESFDAWLSRSRRENAGSYLVCVKETRAIAGVFNLSEIVRGPFQCAYTGYYAHQAHAGNGYMREGLELLLRHAFRTLGLHRLEANIQPENAPSIALVRGAGFRLEGFSPRYLKINGRWRDHERWAITVEDWRTRSATP
jgi:[ribosomal protein S5]-alanine N-acetyltransferase